MILHLNNGLYFAMHLVTKLDAVHLADTIEQKKKQSKHGTDGKENSNDGVVSI